MDQATPRAGDPRGWAYGPGEWYAVLGPGTAVLLPPGERARVGPLWAAVDDGAGVDALLDTLLAGGLSGLAGFVLLSVDPAVDATGDAAGDPAADPAESGGGDAVRVLVRGEAVVTCETAEGPVVLSGRDAATWTERRLVGVRATRVAPGDQPGGHMDADRGAAPAAYVLGRALVRVAWLAHPGAPAPAGAAPPITEPEPVAPEPVEPSPVPPPPPGPVPEPGPEPEPEPSPAGERDTDHDGATRGGAGGPVARLLLPDGAVVDVDRVVLLGRDPEARPRADPGQEPGEPRLVRLPSPLHEISSTHLEVRPGSGADQGAAVATDLGSTNGTIVRRPDLRPEDLQPWRPVPLAPGAVLDVGDGLTIQVAAP